MNIVIPVVLVVIVGLLASCMLSYASKVFAVQEDQLFLDLRAELPGANCGGSTCAQSSPEQTAAAAALQDVTTTRTRWQRAVRLPARSALSAVPL